MAEPLCSATSHSAMRYIGQGLFYALFFLPIVYFTQEPSQTILEPNKAVLKVAVRHPGKIIGECQPIEGAELARVPGNMKLPEICPRERSSLRLKVLLDGEPLYAEKVKPAGLHSDGISSVYRRFSIPAGNHDLELYMNDDVSVPGFNWQLQEVIELQPAQVIVASFREGFRLE